MFKIIFGMILGAVFGAVGVIVIACLTLESELDDQEERREREKHEVE